MRSRDDASLLDLFAQKGDETAFREIARRYGPLVYAACLRDVRRPDLAEDAAQATFLALARKAGHVRVRTTLVPWLLAASRLAARNVLRAERRRPTVPLDESVPAPPLPTSDDALFAALDALGAAEREAVVLRFVQGLSLAEVGRAQGVSEDAARMRVSRALKRLRTEYVPVLAAPLSFSERLATLPLPKPSPLMTTPLLLAISGAVVATGAFAGLRRKTESLTPPTLQAKAAPQAKPSVAAKAEETKPGPHLPKIATLDKPFTLVYRMTTRNVQTPAARQAVIDARRKELAAKVEADEMTQAEADREIAENWTVKPGPASSKEITISYDGRTLLYEEPDRGPVGSLSISLFDGRLSYHFTPGYRNVEVQGSLWPGTVSHFTQNMPYVGPALPLFPMTRADKILDLHAWEDKLHYSRGTAVVGRGGSATRLSLGVPRPMADEIALSDFTKLQGRLVARSVAVTERETSMREFLGQPKFRTDYALVSATPTPVSPERFDPDHYVADGDDFGISPQNPGPQSALRKFKVDRAKGTLQQQIAAASGR